MSQLHAIFVYQPPYDGVARLLKQLAKARKQKQYADRTDAIDLVSATVKTITAKRTFDGPCALRDVINKAAKRNKKFRDALNLIGFER